jgi:hypothetical protein
MPGGVPDPPHDLPVGRVEPEQAAAVPLEHDARPSVLRGDQLAAADLDLWLVADVVPDGEGGHTSDSTTNRTTVLAALIVDSVGRRRPADVPPGLRPDIGIHHLLGRAVHGPLLLDSLRE